MSSVGSHDSLDILAQVASNDSIKMQPLIIPEDRPTIAEFLYLVMEQLRPCRFTDADRNKRRSKSVGSVGVECRHCAGKIDGRKFFWSSVSAAESNFVSVHSHMLTCKYIPDDLKAELARLKALRREQTQRLKSGSQKAFFTRVWARLHGTTVPEVVSSSGPSRGKISAGKEIVVHSPKKKSNAGNDQLELPMLNNHDPEELRALLESKSTLSSMPSVDESIAKHATQDQQSLEMDLGHSDSHELNTGQSGESGDIINSQGSKSSLTTVALNLSTVTVHCKEEQMNTAEV